MGKIVITHEFAKAKLNALKESPYSQRDLWIRIYYLTCDHVWEKREGGEKCKRCGCFVEYEDMGKFGWLFMLQKQLVQMCETCEYFFEEESGCEHPELDVRAIDMDEKLKEATLFERGTYMENPQECPYWKHR